MDIIRLGMIHQPLLSGCPHQCVRKPSKSDAALFVPLLHQRYREAPFKKKGSPSKKGEFPKKGQAAPGPEEAKN